MSQATGDLIHAAISYSRSDQKRVETILNGLKSRGLVIWFDKDIPGGALWEEIIARKYRACGALLFFVSKASLASQRCSEEVSTARTLGKPIIPVLVDQLKLPDDLPDRFVLTLQARNTVDAFDRTDADVETAILAALDGFGIKPGEAPVMAPAPVSAPRSEPVRPAPSAAPAASPARAGGGNGMWIAFGGAFTAIGLVIGAYFLFVQGGSDGARPAASVAATTATTAAAPPAATAQPEATPPAVPGAKMAIGAESYPVGVPIKVKVTDMPGDERDNVAIAKAGAKLDTSVSSMTTGGAITKSLTMQPVMEAGDYELRLFYGSDIEKGAVLARETLPFKVVAPGPITLKLAKETYAEGEPLSIVFTGLPGNERDWIAVAKAEAGESEYIAYEYTKGLKDGTIGLRPMVTTGEFEIRVYFDDTTGNKTVRARQVFTVTPAPEVTLATDAETYAPGADIKIKFAAMPGNERDWFSIAKADSEDTAYVTYVYTDGKKDGTVSLRAPDEPGAYEIRAYFDDSTGDKTVRARSALEIAAPGAEPAAEEAPAEEPAAAEPEAAEPETAAPDVPAAGTGDAAPADPANPQN